MTDPFPQPPARPPAPPSSRRLPPVAVALAVSVAVALLAVAAALALVLGRPKPPPPAAAERGMLQVETARAGEEKLDPAKPLRCFVNGQFVGEATLAACAARNGVAAQNLDVGLDPSGQVAAQGGAAAPLAPLPQPNLSVAAADGEAVTRRAPGVTPDATDGAVGGAPGPACLRFSNGGWRSASAGDGSVRACVHELYDDRCVQPGQALYGRYGQQTLRLVPGRVEVSDDNRRFRYLLGQDSDSCALED